MSAPVAAPRPLAESDDRSAFDCGRESLNGWFRRHAWSNHLTGASRVNVLTKGPAGRVVAFVSLSATQIERAALPKRKQRNRPDPVPATLIGQLAVDRGHQGRGHAASLLIFAFRTALRAADHVGSAGVLTHPLDDGVRAFYARHGFADLPYDSGRAMFVRMVDLRANFSLS